MMPTQGVRLAFPKTDDIERRRAPCCHCFCTAPAPRSPRSTRARKNTARCPNPPRPPGAPPRPQGTVDRGFLKSSFCFVVLILTTPCLNLGWSCLIWGGLALWDFLTSRPRKIKDRARWPASLPSNNKVFPPTPPQPPSPKLRRHSFYSPAYLDLCRTAQQIRVAAHVPRRD